MKRKCGSNANRIKSRGRGGAGVTKGEDAAREAEDRAKVGMARAAVPDSFVTNAILLCGERQRNKGGGQEIGFGTGEGVQGTGADPELDILDPKEGPRWGGGRGPAQVFPRTEQEIETHDEAVGGRMSQRGGFQLGQGPHLGNNGNGEGFDPLRRGIGLLPCTKQRGEADIHRAVRVQTRVRGPQPGVRLTHRSYGVLHCPRSDRVAAARERSGAVALCKELEQRDKVVSAQGEGVEVQGSAVCLPVLPTGAGGGSTLRRNARGGRFLQSAPIKEELVSGCRGCSCQDAACG